MELQVRIEPLVVLGEPLIIDGWVFGVLVPAGPDESFAVQYKKSIVVRRMIRNSREFLLGYINVVDNQSARPSTYEKQLCSVVKKYGVIGHCFTMPPSPPLGAWTGGAEQRKRNKFLSLSTSGMFSPQSGR
ncbi:MAG: hypothetical protein ABSD88_18085 [Candidatus Korobacteraceae bacterium]